MKLHGLAAELGVNMATVRTYFSDIISQTVPGDWEMPEDTLTAMRKRWEGGDNTFVFAQFWICAGKWRELRSLLAKGRGKWAVAIDPHDETGNIYIMITYFGEIRWADRGPELYERLVGAVGFLTDAMVGMPDYPGSKEEKS